MTMLTENECECKRIADCNLPTIEFNISQTIRQDEKRVDMAISLKPRAICGTMLAILFLTLYITCPPRRQKIQF